MLNRIHVARGFTAYQHYSAFCDLPIAVNRYTQTTIAGDTDTTQRPHGREQADHDQKSSRERVVLAHEDGETYDPSYYETQLVRAVESVLLPLGRDRTDIRRERAETRELDLMEFAAVGKK